MARAVWNRRTLGFLMPDHRLTVMLDKRISALKKNTDRDELIKIDLSVPVDMSAG